MTQYDSSAVFAQASHSKRRRDMVPLSFALFDDNG